MKIKRDIVSGFTLVEIMIVIAIIGMLAAIAIPNYVHARGLAQKTACINNLRQIDGAKQQWALENHKVDTDTPAEADLNSYLRSGMPTCPGGGSYTIGAMNANPTCSLAAQGHLLPAGTSGNAIPPAAAQ